MIVNEQAPAPSRRGSRRPAASGPAVAAIPVASIEPNPFQPRTGIGEEQLRELAASMAAEGLVQPITVRPHPTKPGAYQLIAGERRWRAAHLLRWETIAALRREADDVQMRLLASVAHGQREHLTPVDEADAFSQLLAETGWSQADLARRIGKSRPYVIERLQLREAPDLQQAVHEGLIPFSVARAMRRLIADPDQRRALLDEARHGGTVSLATVRAVAGAPPALGALPAGPAAPRMEYTGGTGAAVGLPGWLHTSPGALPTVDPVVNERMDYFGSDVRALVEQVRELRQRASEQYPEVFGATPSPGNATIRGQFAALAMVLAAEGYALAEAWRQGLADDAALTEAAR